MSLAFAHTETDTRSRIMETAERLFREIGYQKTTVADIARTLKMSPANVYRFFDSKKAINEAVAERLMRHVEETIAGIAARGGTAEARLREMILVMHRMNEGLYTSDQRMHEMVETALNESWQVVEGHIHRKCAIFEGVVREGIESGEFAPGDPHMVSHCVQLCMMRYFHPLLLVQCGGTPGPTIEQLTDFVMRAVKTPAPAR